MEILHSPRINAFLDTVESGQRFGFFDMDQTITVGGVDTEERALRMGLAPTFSDDLDLVDDREKILKLYDPKFTPEAVRELGRSLGQNLFAENAFRPEALQVLQACQEMGVRIAVLTATPSEIVEGVSDVITQTLGCQIYVLGREIDFQDKNGPKEKLFMYGRPKKEVVLAARGLGGIPLIGAGDKAYIGGSDEFVFECGLQIKVNNSDNLESARQWHQAFAQLASI